MKTSSSGDGQYDAFVKALRNIYKVKLGKTFPKLDNYQVTIPPGGRTDALVQTVITWREGDRISAYPRLGCRPDRSSYQGNAEDD